jgi:hypothetical protein
MQVEHSHNEPDVFRLTPVLEVLEIIDELGFREVVLDRQFSEVQRVRQALDELPLHFSY